MALSQTASADVKLAVAGFTAVTAAGSGDNTEINGGSIDRKDYRSVKLCASIEAVLAEGETAILKNATVQDSADGSTWADVDTSLFPAAGTVLTLTGDTGGSTEAGVYELDVPCGGLNRYVRLQITPDLSASGTDTATVHVFAVKAGPHNFPAA